MYWKLSPSAIIKADRPLVWKKYTEDVFSICNMSKGEITQFIEEVKAFTKEKVRLF